MYLQKRLKLLTEMLKIQIEIITKRVRFRVIVFLYFIPKERARSLPTLIAANVNKDTPLKHEPTTSLMLKMAKQS